MHQGFRAKTSLVEHRRLELLTPTLPVSCATNCANAPRTNTIIPYRGYVVKREIRKKDHAFHVFAFFLYTSREYAHVRDV